MNRDELVQDLRDSGSEALAAMMAVPESALERGCYEQGWTVRQIMAHVASMEFAYRRLPELARGSRDAQTTTGGGRFDMDGYNARQVEKRKSTPPAELAEEFRRGRGALVVLIADTEAELLDTPVRTAGGVTGSLGQAIQETAVSHVRTHSSDFARAAGSAPNAGDWAAAALLISAAEVSSRLESTTTAQWRYRSTPDDWSAAGITGHLIELMPYWATRLAASAGEPSLTLERDIDAPERLGGVVEGEAMPPAQAAEALDRAASEAVAILRGIPENQWQNVVEGPRYGRLSVADMAGRLLVMHSRDHIRQIAAALAAADGTGLSG